MSPADKSMTNECSAVITERKNCEECDGDTPASNDGHRDLNVITVGFYNNLTINFSGRVDKHEIELYLV